MDPVNTSIVMAREFWLTEQSNQAFWSLYEECRDLGFLHEESDCHDFAESVLHSSKADRERRLANIASRLSLYY